MIKALGYSDSQLKQQQDASEFQLTLNCSLEELLKNTAEEHIYRKLFYGEKENVIKCVNIDYESVQKESFTVLQLHL